MADNGEERNLEMSYQPKKSEFSIKETFEELEKQKDPKYRRCQRKEDGNGLKLLQSFGVSLVGAVCGGIIFFACRWWFSIFSVLFFLINGVAAYVFCKEFVKKETKVRGQLSMIFAADIVSVFLTLTSIYLLIPDYYNERVNKGFSAMDALVNYLFNGMINNMVWIVSLIISFLGIFFGWLICKGIRKKPKKKISKKK